MPRIRIAAALACAAVLLLLTPAAATAQGQAPTPTASLVIPSSVEAARRQLQVRLPGAGRAGGRTGTAVRELDRVLRPHFLKDELLALPLLGLLPGVVFGIGPADAPVVADQLAAHLAQEEQVLYPAALLVGAYLQPRR